MGKLTEEAATEQESEILQNLIPIAPEIKPEDKEETPEITESDREVDEKLQEIEKETTEAIINSDFVLYEKFLLEKNKTLFGLFDDLILIKESSEPHQVLLYLLFRSTRKKPHRRAP